jgi:N-acetylmuramoyl-L-alanine amidase
VPHRSRRVSRHGGLLAAASISGLLATIAVTGCGGSPRALAQARRTTAAEPATTPAAAEGATTSTTRAPANRTSGVARNPPVLKPQIVWDPIPFGPERKAQMVAYVRRHYGSFMKPTWRLVDPHVIVVHYTDASYSSSYNTFATDVPDSELHELPATCAHFVIDTDGTIHQLVSLGTMCRHTVGLNWTAIGIEHVGYSDAQVLGDHRQITASLQLVRWLRCRYHIPIRDVIGHNESLTSPYHHEDVPALRTQTHSDFNHADMQVYRRRLSALGGCPSG